MFLSIHLYTETISPRNKRSLVGTWNRMGCKTDHSDITHTHTCDNTSLRYGPHPNMLSQSAPLYAIFYTRTFMFIHGHSCTYVTIISGVFASVEATLWFSPEAVSKSPVQYSNVYINVGRNCVQLPHNHNILSFLMICYCVCLNNEWII